MTNVIDQVNLRTMQLTSAVKQYANDRGLFPSERAALNSVLDEARGKPILDIGVGGGGTVRPLLEVSGDYRAVDYSQEMLKVCRRRHPGVRVDYMDARHMEGVADNSIFLVMFGCNGVCMVGHEDRVLIMREVFRVLMPGGVFLFSTYNQESPQCDAGFQFPPFRGGGPLRFPFKAAGFLKHTAIGLYNRSRLRRLEVRNTDYAIINDIWHDYGTMEYYISAAKQRHQLELAGFAPDAVAYDDDAHIVGDKSASHSLFFVARKPK